MRHHYQYVLPPPLPSLMRQLPQRRRSQRANSEEPFIIPIDTICRFHSPSITYIEGSNTLPLSSSSSKNSLSRFHSRVYIVMSAVRRDAWHIWIFCGCVFGFRKTDCSTTTNPLSSRISALMYNMLRCDDSVVR